MMYHGTLVAINGLGVLLQGPPGIGKSNAALHLIDRHHQLISDDCIIINKKHHKVIGTSPKETQGKLWVYSLGLIDITSIYGPESLIKEHSIDVIITLQAHQEKQAITSITPQPSITTLQNTDIATFMLPTLPHSNIALHIELLLRDYHTEQ